MHVWSVPQTAAHPVNFHGVPVPTRRGGRRLAAGSGISGVWRRWPDRLPGLEAGSRGHRATIHRLCPGIVVLPPLCRSFALQVSLHYYLDLLVLNCARNSLSSHCELGPQLTNQPDHAPLNEFHKRNSLTETRQ